VTLASDPDLFVDLDALDLLARQLGQIKDALAMAKENVTEFDARLGSPRLHDSLDDFVKGWKDGRKKITEDVDGLVDKITGAAEAYRANEKEIIKATRGG
jgi:hypothetical protein